MRVFETVHRLAADPATRTPGHVVATAGLVAAAQPWLMHTLTFVEVFFGVLGGVLGATWYAISIYETKTTQNWLAWRRQARLAEQAKEAASRAHDAAKAASDAAQKVSEAAQAATDAAKPVIAVAPKGECK